MGEVHEPHSRRVFLIGHNMLRLSDLVGKTVYDQTGKSLGRIDEVRVKNSRVEALICGLGARLQRMGQLRTGNRVDWRRVRSIRGETVLCGPVLLPSKEQGTT
jgi:sporulation protein YlmC with PRC-barrel domain